MRAEYIENNAKDEKLNYRGIANSRLNNLTDAVFGIALALLIFNVTDANSFQDLLLFAKTFPALLVSILFLYLIWKEHVTFTVLYGIQGFRLQFLNVLFIALVIFYVYPLRFLTNLLTNMVFKLDIQLQIQSSEVPDLMIFYGAVTFAIYMVLYLFYLSALKQKDRLNLSKYEQFYTKAHGYRMLIMAIVPFISLLVSLLLKNQSLLWASVLGGSAYGLYPIFIEIWRKKYNNKKAGF